MAKYRKQRQEYDAWKAERLGLIEARKMLGLVDEEGAAAQTKEHEAEPARKPPLRPMFTLFGEKGHWQVLQDRVHKKKEADARAAHKEWLRQDSLRMEAELKEAQEAAKAGGAPKRQASVTSVVEERVGGDPPDKVAEAEMPALS